MQFDPTNLTETLAFLAAPTSAMAWAILVSDFYRNQEWMGQLQEGVRQLIVVLSQVVPPVGAYAALQVFTPEQIEAAAPHYAMAAAVAIAVLASRGVFEMTKNRSGGVG